MQPRKHTPDIAAFPAAGTRLSRLAATIMSLLCILVLGVVPLTAAPMQADDETLADRPIAKVTIVGLKRTNQDGDLVNQQVIKNNLRVAAGQPYDAQAVRDDVLTLSKLSKFKTITADAMLLDDGAVEVIYRVTEQPLIQAIQVVGNKLISDQKLIALIPLRAGGPRDDFLLEQSIVRIKNEYKDKGNYLVEVGVDESRLEETGILIFTIIEGPRIKIKEIEFVGNESFTAKQLISQIRTKPAFFLFRKGQLDEEQLIDDVASLNSFYKDRGFLDVRVDRRIQLSADNREAKITFVISEGRPYLLDSVIVEGTSSVGPVPLRVFSGEQIRGLMVMQKGDVYTSKLVEQTKQQIENSYLVMGYVDVRVNHTEVRTGEVAQVDMVLSIFEGEAVTADMVTIQGNIVTRDKVIRRLVRIQPGRPLDGREIEDAKTRIERTRLFSDVRVTVQEPSSGDPTARDVLVEVKEKNTGSVNFGAGIGTDSGFFGEISINQENFDLYDYPRSFNELITGRAFRGAGQKFSIVLAPGNEVSNFSVNFSEPHLFNTDYSGSFSGYYRTRVYTKYNEDRLGAAFGVGRQLGDIWYGSIGTGVQRIELSDFDPSTPIEVYEDRGPAVLMNVAMNVKRNTLNNQMRPSKGSILDVSMRQFFGDYQFTNARADFTTFITTYEDFMGYKQILRLKTNVGYIFGGEAPVYERFYLGGRSFRGFEFRTISPKSRGAIDGESSDSPIGGSFMFFAGAQYEIPIFRNNIAVVGFIDSGTVQDTVGFSEYRVSVGAGLRLYIPQLGPAPMAFDFGFPMLKQEDDQSQLFSFSVEVPF